VNKGIRSSAWLPDVPGDSGNPEFSVPFETMSLFRVTLLPGSEHVGEREGYSKDYTLYQRLTVQEKWSPDGKLPESSKHVENEWRLPMKIKDSPQVTSCWLFFKQLLYILVYYQWFIYCYIYLSLIPSKMLIFHFFLTMVNFFSIRTTGIICVNQNNSNWENLVNFIFLQYLRIPAHIIHQILEGCIIIIISSKQTKRPQN